MKNRGWGKAARTASALLLTAVLLALTSCGSKDGGTMTLTGIFESEAVDMTGDYIMAGKPVICGKSLCVYAVEKTDEDDRVYISAYDTETGDVSFIRIPIGLDEICFAVGENEDVLLMCREKIGYGVSLVRGGDVIWSLDLKDIMTVPSGPDGSQNLLYSDGLWYVVFGGEIGVIGADGKAVGHLTEDEPFILSFVSEDGVHAVTKKRHLILSGAKAEEGTPWEGLIPEKTAIFPADGSRFLSMSGSGADMTYIGSRQSYEFISWVNSGVDPHTVSGIYYISDDVIYLYRSGAGDSTVVKMTRRPDTELERSRIVAVTCPKSLWFSDIHEAALKFNSSRTGYRVILDDIGDEDYETALDLRLADGSAGDIIILPGNTPAGKYLDKNIFVDLYEDTAEREDIFSCVRKLYEDDGRLLVMPRTFSLSWYSFTDPDIDPGWTYDEFINMLDGGAKLFGNEYIGLFNFRFRRCWYENILHGGAFDREMFIEYCQRFIRLKSENKDYRSFTRSGNVWLEGKEALCEASGGLLYYIKSKAVWGKGASVGFAGMPTKDGGRYCVDPSEIWGILKKAAGLEGAKAFLRYYTGAGFARDRDYFDSLSSVPSVISAYRALCERSRESSKYYFIPYDFSFNYASCDEYTDELYGAAGYCAANDKALADEFERFMDTAEPMPLWPEDLLDIIDEELSAVEGGRDMNEIADICENRVSLWLAEHDY